MDAVLGELHALSIKKYKVGPERLERLLAEDGRSSPHWLLRQIAYRYEKLEEKKPELLERKGLKIAHISDTHNFHRYLSLDAADVLIHSGDISGNYGSKYKDKLAGQILDFALWLHEVGPRFRAIVIIAGNHDKPLESGRFRTIFCKALPKHAIYLHDSLATVLGLRIYGTPICICREELFGKRYSSNAFEMNRVKRIHLFEQIPYDLDILITHIPPRSSLASRLASCDLLTQAIQVKKPKIVCFGHDHNYMGISYNAKESILFSNGAQASLLDHQFKIAKKQHNRLLRNSNQAHSTARQHSSSRRPCFGLPIEFFYQAPPLLTTTAKAANECNKTPNKESETDNNDVSMVF